MDSVVLQLHVGEYNINSAGKSSH